ncbi:acyl-CoA synthetase [Oleomonas cavernae]|uniref:Acyl-CoA synthetase n=1 Tax=Oleomonas cavernae TaxID=2320859 RepID=A0A418WAH7_9PROT|nr:AMP-binding protein [Oleomonas cavernae]RJF86979.1 acyl-CoA synthetase [Oleomonas cavernae]
MTQFSGNVHAALEATCRDHGGRTALTFLASGEPGAARVEVTYTQLLAGIAQAANLFRARGIGRRDAVAILLPSLVDTQLVLWGAEAAGIAFPVNPLLQVDEIAALIQAAGAKVLVAFGPAPGIDIWEKALKLRDRVDGITTLVKVGGGPVETPDVVDFAAARSAMAPTLAFADRAAADDEAAYFHTGGTTGSPKLVIHTHRNQLAAAYGVAAGIELTPDDAVTNGLPMFHVGGTIISALAFLLVGARVVLLSPSGFRNPSIAANYWRIVEETGATLVGGVPTALAAVGAVDPAGHDLSAVRLALCGGASTPKVVAQRIEQITGKPLREVYGMTETAGAICIDPISAPRVLGSAGLPIPFCRVEARAVLADGAVGDTCPPGVAGVIVVFGPNVTPGYKNKAQNRGLFTADGWLITGDLGFVDGAGRVFITGRAKDLIIRGGHNIDPAIIEECLLAHPGVRDAAAVGMPDGYAGEVPVAYVVLKPDRADAETALLAFAAERIAERPALPKRIIVVDQLPLTPVGKVFKPALRLDCAERLFREVLAGEALDMITVQQDAQRGLVIQLAAAPDLSLQSRVATRLQNYLVTVDWTEA